MKIFFAGGIPQAGMETQDAEILTGECRMYNAMFPVALKILLDHFEIVFANVSFTSG